MNFTVTDANRAIPIQPFEKIRSDFKFTANDVDLLDRNEYLSSKRTNEEEVWRILNFGKVSTTRSLDTAAQQRRLKAALERLGIFLVEQIANSFKANRSSRSARTILVKLATPETPSPRSKE